jgi:sugar O-acyltransferase (sialic acid O-acetyltransferase NeuD family)
MPHTAPNTTRIWLIGGGGHALVVASAARAAGLQIAGFFDDNPRAALAVLDGVAWLGTTADLAGHHARSDMPTGSLMLAIGDLATRQRVLRGLVSQGITHEQLRCVVRHPEAIVDQSATLAEGGGIFLGPRAIVQAHARIGAYAMLNSGAIVEHECEIGENTHIAPGAILAGNVRVGGGTLVGIGARVLPGVRIGSGCVIGAGSVVTRDVANGMTVVGAPARATESTASRPDIKPDIKPDIRA